MGATDRDGTGPAQLPAAPSTRRRQWRLALFALITLALFFVALEGLLWLAGVENLYRERDPYQGFSRQVPVYERDDQAGVYRTRQRALVHSFNAQQFVADKPADGLRVFVVGGSSAYGFPWGASVSFTALLGRALQTGDPSRSVEAINAAAMSYGSHRLRILVEELLTYEPDVLIVYGGHNEFVERRFYSDVLAGAASLRQARGWLARLRSFSLMTRLYERRSEPRQPADVADVGELLGLDVDREYSTDVRQAERDEALLRFEENLRAIVDRALRGGVSVVLCTLPSNVRGWAPNQSAFSSAAGPESRKQVRDLLLHGTAALERADARTAVDVLERARNIDPSYAETHYRLGQAYEELQRWPEAREAYVRARDLDAQPARATSALNEAIRRIAAERGVLLVDTERVFEAASPHGLVGFNLIEDYVHPNPRGHREIAFALWQAFHEQGWSGPTGAAARAAFDEALGDLPEPDGQPATTAAMLFNTGVVLENQGLLDQAMEKYRACLALNPAYRTARFNLGRLLAQQGRFAEAAETHRQTLEQAPDDVPSWIGLGEALRHLGRLEEAQHAFRRATEADPTSAESWNRLGVVRAQLNRHAEAETALRRAVELDPGSADGHVDLGFSLLFQNKIPQARAAFERAVAREPDHLRGRNGLAATLAEAGRLDEAEALFRDNLRLDPADAAARHGLEVIQRRRAAGAR